MRLDSGVGAGADSYYEYLLKVGSSHSAADTEGCSQLQPASDQSQLTVLNQPSEATGRWPGAHHSAGACAELHPASPSAPQAYLLFGDETFLRMFADAYAAAVGTMQLVGEYSQLRWLVDVHAGSGRISRVWISSLAAFWPGMQALIGVPHPVAACGKQADAPPCSSRRGSLMLLLRCSSPVTSVCRPASCWLHCSACRLPASQCDCCGASLQGTSAEGLLFAAMAQATQSSRARSTAAGCARGATSAGCRSCSTSPSARATRWKRYKSDWQVARCTPVPTNRTSTGSQKASRMQGWACRCVCSICVVRV